MYRNSQKKSGNGTGGNYSALFDLHKVTAVGETVEKPVTVKFTPGSDDYKLIMEVSRRLPRVKLTKIVRVLMRTGFLAYRSSIEREVVIDD
jgi:hypothetical protein